MAKVLRSDFYKVHVLNNMGYGLATVHKKTKMQVLNDDIPFES